MSKPWILVSPASRGIGHALTRHLLRTTTAPILATSRGNAAEVRASLLDSSTNPDELSKRLHITHIDVEQESTVEAAVQDAKRLFPPATHHLHLAFALPGILHPEKSLQDIDINFARDTFNVNALGPLLLMKWFGDMLPRQSTDVDMHKYPVFNSPGNSKEAVEKENSHATFLTLSARVGSTTDNRLGGWYTHRASKAAVNSLTKTFDLHLKTRSGDRAVAVAYHPGTVRTELSREFWGRVRPEKLFTPEYAAERLVEVVRSRTLGDRGKCWDWKGEEVLP